MTGSELDPVGRLLSDAIERRCFPAAVVEVGDREAVRWRRAFGRLGYDSGDAACIESTLFDLASLTKVIVTTTLAMRLVQQGRLTLDTRVAARLSTWRGADRAGVTVCDLLEHASGLTAYLPFYRDLAGRAEFEAAIGELELEYRPRTRSVYSDLGFMVLAFIIEDVAEASLRDQWEGVRVELEDGALRFGAVTHWPGGIAPTELDRWRGRMLVGEVHDENAYALGGAAGHAGLFGTAGAVGAFARSLLRVQAGRNGLVSSATLRRFWTPSRVSGSSRALGWDTMRPTSSCGRLMSPAAVGHTGFTGTSLWLDPDRGAYVVMLTNRVHPTRDNEGILEVRRELHDAVMRAIDAHPSGSDR